MRTTEPSDSRGRCTPYTRILLLLLLCRPRFSLFPQRPSHTGKGSAPFSLVYKIIRIILSPTCFASFRLLFFIFFLCLKQRCRRRERASHDSTSRQNTLISLNAIRKIPRPNPLGPRSVRLVGLKKAAEKVKSYPLTAGNTIILGYF